MVVGELKFITATRASDASYYLKLPSGGTYFVFGFKTASGSTAWHGDIPTTLMAGGAYLVGPYSSSVSQTYTFLIRRVS